MNFLNLDLFTIVARIMVILLILPLHEFAHAFVAKKCGDYTAESSGRLTFNPFAHVDPFGAVLLLLTGYGWAKPVPVNPIAMRNPRNGIIWTSLAGPFSNLLAAFVSMILLRVVEGIPIPYDAQGMYNVLSSIDLILFYFTLTNIGLAVFNLIPIPPLDGSKVLMQFLPTRAVIWIQQNQMIVSVILIVLIISPALDKPLAWCSGGIYSLFVKGTNWVDFIMKAITG